jgi:hypothetical protein
MTEPNIVIKSKNGRKRQKIQSRKREKKFQKLNPKSTTSAEEITWRSSPVKQPVDHEPSFSWQAMWPFLFSIIGAILIGVILGFSVLTLFADHSSKSVQKTAQTHQQKPGLSAFLIQVGKETNVPPYRQRKQLRLKGLSVVMTKEQPYRLLLGVAVEQKQAAKLVHLYQRQGIDVKAKQWNFQGREKDVPTALRPMTKVSHPLFQRLASFAITQLQKENPSKHNFVQERKQYQQMLKHYRQGRKQLQPIQRKQAIRMLQAMEQAVESGVAWSRYPSDPLLQQMQEGLVRYIMAYKQLVEVER